MKLMMVVAASACAVSLSATAAESNENTTEATEAEETSLFSFGADLDFFSAYVWRNAVQNDEMVMQPCVWADFNALDPLTLGFFIWQNYDLTDARRAVSKHALAETDYNLHASCAAWRSEDEALSLDLELGHDWYTYQGVRGDEKSGYPDTRELYVKATFANPVADVYGQASWMYDDFGEYKAGLYYELGLKREFEVAETVTVGADWNVGFGDSRYTNYLFGEDSYGFGGTTLKLYSSWQLTDWLALKGTIAYTGVLNGDIRDAMDEDGLDYDFYGDKYPRDILWGGLSLNVEF